MKKSWVPLLPLLAISLLLGGALDFVFNGVLKIIWLVIYGPAYAVACHLYIWLVVRTRYAAFWRESAIAFLLGALVMHLTFTGQVARDSYPMTLASSDPLTLVSQTWPQKLIVVSKKLSAQIATAAPPGIVVVIRRINDYGCTRSSVVESVDGVDVENDPEARWTWKRGSGADETARPRVGPGNEDQGLPWCQIKFYRGGR
jgi:hypothetical protein